MRVLVVGGTGFLGRALTAAASDAGHDVQSLGSAGLDLRDPIPPFDADAVVNCAYVRDGPLRWPVTVDGAVALANACVASNARLVQLSTDLVFAGRHAPYTSADPPDPVNGYGRAKAAMERLVLAAMPHALIVRTSLLWGAEDGPQEALVREACSGGEIRFFTTEVRCPIRVDVLSRSLVDDLTSVRHGIVHRVGEHAMNRLEFARLVAAQHRWDASALTSSEAAVGHSARPGRLVLRNG